MKKVLSLVLALAGVLAVTGCHSAAPPKPLDQLSEHESRGHDVFQSRCAACHYDRVQQPLHGPPLLGILKKKYLPSGAPANDERITATVLHGHNLMPAQPNIDPQDLDDLLAYLHTL